MFIKLIEIYNDWEGKQLTYKLREVVVNKRNIIEMRSHSYHETDKLYGKFPDGINPSLQYTSLYMIDNHREIVVVGDLTQIYTMFEKDSELNHRQTLRG